VVATLEDIKNVVNDVDLINTQIKQLEEARTAGLLRIDTMDNERALFTEEETRETEAFLAELLVLADEKVTSGREKKLTAWAKTIDPNLSMRGWGIDNEKNELFPDFAVEVPKVITDEFVRNINFFAHIVSSVQPARLWVVNRTFLMGYDSTSLRFDGENLQDAFTVCGSSRSGTSKTLPLLATLRNLSERAFSSWNNPLN
jgi:hypothetical protein